MQTHCPHCEVSLVRINVPGEIREHAPEKAAIVGSCPRCLRVYAAIDHGATDRSTADLPTAVPDGDGGVALVLVLGHLDSIALNRAAIQSLLDYAEAAGTDVFLALDRLADDDSLAPHVDIARRRRQLESLL
ncbi:DUF6276 family protein [Halobellus captivus]|uniref:DUF6276 family protein n=1 Tax=Halobellus captivus TaxID=2592614 RepID=UPI0011A044A6|nr:DUF6276 family protein [Halobellus captivus]